MDALDTLPECQLIPVLPTPRADLAVEASRAEFAALLERAEGKLARVWKSARGRQVTPS